MMGHNITLLLDLLALGVPCQSERLARNGELSNAGLAPHIPEFDGAIGAAASQLCLGVGMEGNALEGAVMTLQLGRVLHIRLFLAYHFLSFRVLNNCIPQVIL